MSDAVNHPSYYNRGSVEVIDFIENWRLDFVMGSFVKYICRAGYKDNAIQDLEKAKWYIKRFGDKPCEPYYDSPYNIDKLFYDWHGFAVSQGLCDELCMAMDAAFKMYKCDEVELNAVDVVFLINKVIDDIKCKREDIEHGVIETGSEQ